MGDYRNHRRFMLKCIKASVTPVSCKLKNTINTTRSYNIIHKVEKQLLYERIRNINNILDMYLKMRSKQSSCLKIMLNECEHDINRCLQLINKVKEHRHDKITRKQIDKFKCLYFKKYFSKIIIFQEVLYISKTLMLTEVLLSGHQNVPSRITSTSSNASSNPTTSATPTTSTPSTSTATSPTVPTGAPSHPSSSSSHTWITNDKTKKWVINLSNTPLTPTQQSLSAKGPNFAITSKYPPKEAYITAME